MTARSKITFDKPVAIAVEGADYYHLLISQIARLQPEFENIHLYDFKDLPKIEGQGQFSTGENAELRRWLGIFNATRKNVVKVLGIIRDAEDSSINMITSLQSALTDAKLPKSNHPLAVAPGANDQPATAFLVMPFGANAGCLEDALLQSTPAGQSKQCAAEYLACIANSENTTRNERWRAKVLVHTLIAGSVAPQFTLGQSARAGLWDFEHPALKVMLDFMRELQKFV